MYLLLMPYESIGIPIPKSFNSVEWIRLQRPPFISLLNPGRVLECTYSPNGPHKSHIKQDQGLFWKLLPSTRAEEHHCGQLKPGPALRSWVAEASDSLPALHLRKPYQNKNYSPSHCVTSKHDVTSSFLKAFVLIYGAALCLQKLDLPLSANKF